jgi:hypothetical protein
MVFSRPNTLVVDYSLVPGRLKKEIIHEFISSNLELNSENVISLQVSQFKKQVFIETVSLSVAQETVSKHNMLHKIMYEDIEYLIKLNMVDSAVDVKIHDLPPRMRNESILRKMSEFGEVLSITDERWDEQYIFSNVLSGVRIVRMRIKASISSFIFVEGEQTLVTYTEQVLTCRWCNFRQHPGSKLSENRMQMRSHLPPGGRVDTSVSFAQALRGSTSQVPTPGTTNINNTTTQQDNQITASTAATTTTAKISTSTNTLASNTTPEQNKTTQAIESEKQQQTSMPPPKEKRPTTSFSVSPFHRSINQNTVANGPEDNSESNMLHNNRFFVGSVDDSDANRSNHRSWADDVSMEDSEGEMSTTSVREGEHSDASRASQSPRKKRGRPRKIYI